MIVCICGTLDQDGQLQRTDRTLWDDRMRGDGMVLCRPERHGSVPVQSSSIILEAGGVALEQVVDQTQQGSADGLSI